MTDSSFPQLPLATSGGHACSCCSTDRSGEQEAAGAAQPGAVSTAFGVAGMTCEHCVRSVTEELAELPSVTGVDVALAAGGVSTVTVHSDEPVDRDAVAAAIDEAGYRLVDA